MSLIKNMSGRRISDKTKLKKGIGKGAGKDYKVWFTASEVSSKGRKCRATGLTTNREHLFLSTLEEDYFYCIDFSDETADIREQYKLEMSITKKICADFGIRHLYGKDGKPTHYTTDFLITRKDGSIAARTCKYVKDLNSDKTIKEKFAVEEEFYKRLGVKWEIVREIDFDRIRARHIGSCYKMRVLGRYDKRFLDYSTYKAYVYKLLDLLLTHSDLPIKEVINKYERITDLSAGNGFNVLRHLIINKIIIIDMHSFIVNNEPLIIKRYQKDLDMYLQKKWNWNLQLPSERKLIINNEGLEID